MTHPTAIDHTPTIVGRARHTHIQWYIRNSDLHGTIDNIAGERDWKRFTWAHCFAYKLSVHSANARNFARRIYSWHRLDLVVSRTVLLSVLLSHVKATPNRVNILESSVNKESLLSFGNIAITDYCVRLYAEFHHAKAHEVSIKLSQGRLNLDPRSVRVKCVLIGPFPIPFPCYIIYGNTCIV